jgi:hypothetical protein
MYFRGVDITDTYFTGPVSQIETTLRRSIAAILRDGSGYVRLYIGIASGADHWFALSRRFDQKKKDASVTRMYLLYRSSSLRNTTELERRLIDHFSEIFTEDALWNSTGGGGGRRGMGPNYYLYLAVSEI